MMEDDDGSRWSSNSSAHQSQTGWTPPLPTPDSFHTSTAARRLVAGAGGGESLHYCGRRRNERVLDIEVIRGH